MTDLPPPPPNIALYVDVLGVEATLTLIEKRGGAQFWVPTGIRNSSQKLREELEAELGAAAVRALIETFGGGQITVPLCPEWRTAVYAARGLTRIEIARRLCCHADTVDRRLKRIAAAASGTRQSAWNF